MGELLSSRRDGAIVAWHEVPGTTPPQKTRPVGYGVIRPGVRADWSAEILNTKTEKFMLYDLFQQTVYDIEPQLEYHRTPTFQEEHLALRNTAHISTRIPLGSLRPHTAPYGTVLLGWTIGVGTKKALPLPPNRTGISHASGSPVGG